MQVTAKVAYICGARAGSRPAHIESRGHVKRLRQIATGALCAAAVVLPFLGTGVAQAAAPTPLTLKNGWTNAPFRTSNAAVRTINGVVHFKGAIATSGTNSIPFTLPPGFRPATSVYVPVDLCNATNGRLVIQ